MEILLHERHASVGDQWWYMLEIDGLGWEVSKADLINLAARIDYLTMDRSVRDQPKSESQVKE